jgi:hypothetical protein
VLDQPLFLVQLCVQAFAGTAYRPILLVDCEVGELLFLLLLMVLILLLLVCLQACTGD